jgi:hypothetical protein
MKAIIKGCCGELHLLGVLGRLAWYRCRGCGIQVSRVIKRKKRLGTSPLAENAMYRTRQAIRRGDESTARGNARILAQYVRTLREEGIYPAKRPAGHFAYQIEEGK